MARPYLGNPKYTIEVLQKYHFVFQKRFGQNFLIDEHVLEKIIESSGITKDDFILEIGPGIGTLTQQLALRAEKVTSVELDQRLLPILEETVGEFENLHILHGDILQFDVPQLLEQEFAGLHVAVCANLPYYITTPALSALIDSRCFQTITVMVQKEVAHRICAKAGTADYGAFSVYCQYHARPSIVLDVPAGCFIPAPKVDSAVVRLDRYEQCPWQVEDEKLFFRVVKAAFAQRRKMLRGCLRHGFSQLDAQQIAGCLAQAGLPDTVRGEQLDLAQFALLTQAVARALAQQGENP